MYLLPIVNSQSHLLEVSFAITYRIHSMKDLFSHGNHLTTKISMTMKTTCFFSSFKIIICFAKVMKLPFQREESSQPSQSAR